MKNYLKILPTEFVGRGEVKGFEFHQLLRGKNACIYRVSTPGTKHYEVFKIKVLCKPFTNEQYEAYPKANSFGVWAWSNRQYVFAYNKFKMIEENGHN